MPSMYISRSQSCTKTGLPYEWEIQVHLAATSDARSYHTTT